LPTRPNICVESNRCGLWGDTKPASTKALRIVVKPEALCPWSSGRHLYLPIGKRFAGQAALPSLNFSGQMKSAVQPDARQIILASAEKHFARAGFTGTSIQEIIADTGFTKPTLYYYFQSKEGLFKALLDHAHDTCYERMERAAASKSDLGRKLVAILADLFEFLHDREDLIRLAFAAAFAAPGELPEALRDDARRQRNFNFFLGLVAEGQKARALNPKFTCRELTYGIFGAVSFHLMANVLFPGTPLNRRTAERLVELYFEGAAVR
jgi:AcrR family transcriptional regulator